ncbi:hypothetical protein KZZ20_06900 [Methylacidiphilum fumariolicum]|uniref:hypothetical protein n=1 Tax=Candidatus Methylacidiphilum fumarolicum TaxID=591154 RepID=UPI001CA55B61|nr:hypothetical protein [Candidatus Methylacidiphilum fumarolicum]MBW6415242.1 hypothetical protein [Candidatus Methylacidiphilum fumarolicum]
MIKRFMQKASHIYEMYDDGKMQFEEAEKKVDKLEEKLINSMIKKTPGVLYLQVDKKNFYLRREEKTREWVAENRLTEKEHNRKDHKLDLGHMTDVIKEVVRHNVLNRGNLEVYAVDISTREMKEQERKGNLYVSIKVPEACQQLVEDYLKKAGKSARLGKTPTEGLKQRITDAFQKAGLSPDDKFFEDFFDRLNNVAKRQQKDKDLKVKFEPMDEFFGVAQDITRAFVDYRDQRMAGNIEKKEDSRYGLCNIKRIAQSRNFYYPGPRLIHWGGAYHLGEIKRETNLSKELKKVGFPYVVTADAYTGELRNYPTDFVFESHKGLLKAVDDGIKMQLKSQGFPVYHHVYPTKTQEREREGR